MRRKGLFLLVLGALAFVPLLAHARPLSRRPISAVSTNTVRPNRVKAFFQRTWRTANQFRHKHAGKLFLAGSAAAAAGTAVLIRKVGVDPGMVFKVGMPLAASGGLLMLDSGKNLILRTGRSLSPGWR